MLNNYYVQNIILKNEAKKMINMQCLPVLIRVSIAVKEHHDQSNFYKGKHLIVMAYSFRSSIHHDHGEKHSCMEAVMVLEKELGVLPHLSTGIGSKM